VRRLCLFGGFFAFADAHGLPTGMVLRKAVSLMQLRDRLPTRSGLQVSRGDVLQRLFFKRQVSEFVGAFYHVASFHLTTA
jgi:hypothetical protein